MPQRTQLSRSLIGAAMAALGCLAVVTGAGAQGGGVFAGLAGNWSGTGTIHLSNGSNERIRCRAAYQTDGAASLRQNLRCASDSYTFDLTSNVRSEGGAVSGNWTETTRGASGSVQGRASPGQLQAQVAGSGFSASLSLSTRGDRQSVSIRSEGTELTGVNITLARAR